MFTSWYERQICRESMQQSHWVKVISSTGLYSVHWQKQHILLISIDLVYIFSGQATSSSKLAHH